MKTFTIIIILSFLLIGCSQIQTTSPERQISSLMTGGRETGNGLCENENYKDTNPDSIICTKSEKNSLNGIYPLQFFIYPKDQIQYFKDTDQYINALISKLSEVSTLGDNIKLFYESFKFKNNNNILWFNDKKIRTSSSTQNSNETYTFEIPTNCSLNQIAENEYNNSMAHVHYNSSMFDEIKTTNEEHWIIINKFLNLTLSNSQSANKLNYIFHTRNFFEKSKEEIIELLNNYNFYERNFLKNISYSTFLQNGIIYQVNQHSIIEFKIDLENKKINNSTTNISIKEIVSINNNTNAGYFVKASNNICYIYLPGDSIKQINQCTYNNIKNVSYNKLGKNEISVDFENNKSKVFYLNNDKFKSITEEDVFFVTNQQEITKQYPVSSDLVRYFNEKCKIYFIVKDNKIALIRIENSEPRILSKFHENLFQYNKCNEEKISWKSECTLAMYSNDKSNSQIYANLAEITNALPFSNGNYGKKVIVRDKGMLDNLINELMKSPYYFSSLNETMPISINGKKGIFNIDTGEEIIPAIFPESFEFNFSKLDNGILQYFDDKKNIGIIDIENNCHIQSSQKGLFHRIKNKKCYSNANNLNKNCSSVTNREICKAFNTFEEIVF